MLLEIIVFGLGAPLFGFLASEIGARVAQRHGLTRQEGRDAVASAGMSLLIIPKEKD